MMSEQTRPNILYIMADDHASNAISCYGSRLADVCPTPSLDRVAREGARLEHCFCTNSICTPSRATILSGQHSHVNGVRTLVDDFDPNHLTLARLLQEAGYQTAIVGKWHLHTEPQGFDYYNVLPGQGRYYNPLLKEKGKPWQDHSAGGEVYEGYVTDIITDISLDWLKRRAPQRPFFLMCHHKAPHDYWEFAQRHKSLFADVEIPEPASLWNRGNHGSPATRPYGSSVSPRCPYRNLILDFTRPNHPTGTLDVSGMTDEEKTHAAYQKYLKDYLRCIVGIDENVGRLLDYLDEAGLAENTVVIYTSDQGMLLGEHDYFDKRWIYEESLKMPFLIRYPKEIRPGSVNHDVITNCDFAPTFLDWAGVPAPKEMQGRSFRSNLMGQTPADWPDAMYYRYWMHMAHHYNPAHYGIRTKRYKLVFFYGLTLDAAVSPRDPEKERAASLERGMGPYVPTQPGWELYDCEKDPEEMNNVYDDPAYADVKKELKARLLELKEELGDPDEKYPELMKVREEYWD